MCFNATTKLLQASIANQIMIALHYRYDCFVVQIRTFCTTDMIVLHYRYEQIHAGASSIFKESEGLRSGIKKALDAKSEWSRKLAEVQEEIR